MVKSIYKKLKDDKKYFTVVFFILILIIISGIITPLIINQQKSSWDSELAYQVAEIEKSVKTLFGKGLTPGVLLVLLNFIYFSL